MELSCMPYQREQLDEDRRLRKVCMIFPLKIVKQGKVFEEIDTLIEKIELNVEISGTEKERIFKSRLGKSFLKSELF